METETETINIFNSDNNIFNHTCPICFDNMNDNDFYEMKDCKHKFHYKCIIEWIFESRTCPLCRHNTQKQPTKISLLKYILNFMRSKKNKSKKLKNFYTNYVKKRDTLKTKKSLCTEFKKKNKQILSEFRKIRRQHRDAYWKFQRCKNEISNLPITPICFIKEKK
jgi:hypothetical protein